MPSFYAHYRFGASVLDTLPEPLRSVCTDHRALFDIGLHGPDIFSFFRPYYPNPVSRSADESHKLTGKEFFERFLSVYGNYKDKEALLSYFCGFLCHLALDSVCHPEVYRAERYTGQSHLAIETSFDCTLLIQDGINPVGHDPCGHFQINKAVISAVAAIFSTISEKDVKKSLRGTIFYSRFLFIRNRAVRKLIYSAFRLINHRYSVHDLVMTPQPNPHCLESDKALSTGFETAKNIAYELLIQTHIYIENKIPIGPVFDRSF